MLRRFSALVILCGLTALTVRAEDKPVEVKVGDAAPVFASIDDAGKPWKSADHVGKKVVVVYFYPADMTGGCTKQACGFRDDMAKLAGKDVEVIGVSGDSVENHKVFKAVHNLNFPLLADETATVAKAFGVPHTLGEKSVKTKDADGKDVTLVRKATIQRWTFVIGKDGKIAYKDAKVNAAGDAKAVAAAVEKLK